MYFTAFVSRVPTMYVYFAGAQCLTQIEYIWLSWRSALNFLYYQYFSTGHKIAIHTHTHTRLFSFNFRFCLYLSLALSVARSPLNVWFQLLRRTYMQNHQWLLSYDYCFLNAVSVGFIISHKAPYIRALTHPHARYNYFYHTYTIQSTVDKVVINTTILNISLFCNFIKRMPIPTSLAEIITKVEWAKKQ